MLKGITVTLYETREIGTDEFNKPILQEVPVQVNNVLVSPTSSSEIVNNIDIEGKKAIYTLAIPKGDTHDWVNKKVSFLGCEFKTFGFPIMGIESLIPLDWNMKVMAAKYD